MRVCEMKVVLVGEKGIAATGELVNERSVLHGNVFLWQVQLGLAD
jgi:hypothetical protein